MITHHSNRMDDPRDGCTRYDDMLHFPRPDNDANRHRKLRESMVKIRVR